MSSAKRRPFCLGLNVLMLPVWFMFMTMLVSVITNQWLSTSWTWCIWSGSWISQDQTRQSHTHISLRPNNAFMPHQTRLSLVHIMACRQIMSCRQVIIWTKVGSLSFGPLQAYCSAIWIKILISTFIFIREMPSAKWRPFCFNLIFVYMRIFSTRCSLRICKRILVSWSARISTY